jgi:hypothetical protein
MLVDDLSLIDLPRLRPVEDPLAYLRAALRWHFSPRTGSPYWLRRAKTLGFDPRTDVKSFQDLALFPDIASELRDVPVRDLLPAGYGPNPLAPRVFESGDTTGAPKRVIVLPDYEKQFTAWQLAEMGQPGLRNSGVLTLGPSGSQMYVYLFRCLAARLNSVLFTVELDSRWLKKLVARGDAEEAEVYVDHIVEQAGFVLRTQDVTLLTTTLPLLHAIARHGDLVDIINEKVLRIEVGGAQLDEESRDVLRVVFPNPKLVFSYGSTMILGEATRRLGLPDDAPFIYDAHSPYVTFSVIDPATGRPVPYGERGQVVMNHISKSMFLPNNREPDTAIRVHGPDRQVGDSVSQVKPVKAFVGEALLKGVY